MQQYSACGWLINGNLSRPCAIKPGHKGPHRDQAWRNREAERVRAKRKDPQYRQMEVDYSKAWNASHPTRQQEYYKETRESRREIRRAFARRWRESEAGKEASRRHYHKRRVRKLNAITGPLPRNLTTYLGELYGWECQKCYCKLNYRTLTIDHVIPLNSALPMHVLFNLQPMCALDNSRKKDNLTDWVSVEEIELLAVIAAQ